MVTYHVKIKPLYGSKVRIEALATIERYEQRVVEIYYWTRGVSGRDSSTSEVDLTIPCIVNLSAYSYPMGWIRISENGVCNVMEEMLPNNAQVDMEVLSRSNAVEELTEIC